MQIVIDDATESTDKWDAPMPGGGASCHPQVSFVPAEEHSRAATAMRFPPTAPLVSVIASKPAAQNSPKPFGPSLTAAARAQRICAMQLKDPRQCSTFEDNPLAVRMG